MFKQPITSAQDYYAFGTLMPGRQWTLEKDAPVIEEQCVECRHLKEKLKLIHSYSLVNEITPNSTTLTTYLNDEFHQCADWEFYRDMIYSTCKLWDSTAVFDGNSTNDSSWITFPYISQYNIDTSRFTVEGWIYRDSIAGASEPTIMSKFHENSNTGEIGGFRLYLNSSGNVVFEVGDAPVTGFIPGREARVTTSATIPFRQWKHIVAMRIGNNPTNWRIYINNSNQAVTPSGAPMLPFGTIEMATAHNITIGAGRKGGNNNTWHGRLSRVRLYKSALSVPDLVTAYGGGCGIWQAQATATLDAPLDGVHGTSPRKVDDLSTNAAFGNVLEGVSNGDVSWKIYWRDSTCWGSPYADLFCENVLVDAGKQPRYGFNGKMRDDEMYGIGNSYDFGARLYDLRLGRWLSVDPLFRNYVPISPYSFGLENPNYFFDEDGRKIVDQNGNEVKVTITKNEETGKFEANFEFNEAATSKCIEDTKYLINSLLETEIGVTVAENWVAMPTEISLNVTDIELPGGIHAQTRYQGRLKGGYYKTAEVTVSTYRSTEGRYAPSKTSLEEQVGATTAHEYGHTVPKNRGRQSLIRKMISPKKAEIIPFAYEVKFREQYRTKHKLSSEGLREPYKTYSGERNHKKMEKELDTLDSKKK